MSKIVKFLYIIIGFIALGLGVLGLLLPVLPTTPLLLLASYCFVKGSKKFEHWFKGTKLYKRHLETFCKREVDDVKTETNDFVICRCDDRHSLLSY